MGYQALLFCPDEKLARVVGQVFSELDFAIVPVHEPFAAVKQLMSQRYDAIVVDCDNEQNASLLFRSARNSSSNQSSLAFALVEGQTGVAKAYRIGANLVLTKPINIEQAKGTLRIARGLLRKNAESLNTTAGPTSPAGSTRAAHPSSSSVLHHGDRSATTATPAFATGEHPEAAISAPLTLSQAATSTMEMPGMEMASNDPAAEIADQDLIILAEPITEAEIEASLQALNVPDTSAHRVTAEHRVAEADSAYASSHGAVSGFSSAGGSAAAPAPAKDEKAVEKEISPLPALALDQDKDKDQKDKHSENRITEAKPALVSRPSSAPASVTPITLATSINTDPVFGGITEEDSSRSARTNRILVVAAVVVALAVLGYFSTDGKFGIRDKTAAPQPVNEQLQTQPQTQSVPAPAPATTSAPSDSSTNQPDTASSPGQVSTIQPATGQTPAVPTPTQPPVPTTLTQRLSASVMNSPLVRMGENLVSGTRRTAAALIVKTSRVSAPKPAQVEDPAPPPPQTAIVASANSNASNLNGLMSTAASNIAKPSLVPLNVSQGVTQGLLIKRVTPKYPQAALASHTQGSVQIEATVNKEGDVVNPKILSGDPLLAHAAVEAVRQWRYKPYYLNGNPVEIKTQITVNFKAD